MATAWANFVPYGPVPMASLPLFGAGCHHTPNSEARPTDGTPCPQCRPSPDRPYRGDPIRVHEAHVNEHGEARAEPLALVCGKCGRTLYDNSPAMERAVHRDDGKLREGYEKVVAASGSDGTDKTDRKGRTVAAVKVKNPGRRRRK